MKRLLQTNTGRKIIIDPDAADAVEEVLNDKGSPSEIHITHNGVLHRIVTTQSLEDFMGTNAKKPAPQAAD